jgi:hypothetical protein
MPKMQKSYSALSKPLDEKVNRLLLAVSEDNPVTVTPGADPYLEIAAKALGMSYKDAKKKLSKGNAAVLAVRNDVKTKLFAITYGNGGAVCQK